MQRLASEMSIVHETAESLDTRKIDWQATVPSRRFHVRIDLLALLLIIVFLGNILRAQTGRSEKVGTEEQLFIAAQVYSQLQMSLSARELFHPATDGAPYKDYLRKALETDGRHQFDLTTIEFVARLHDGHTFFWDTWLDKSNQPLGFYAAPLGGYWVVQTSLLPGLKPGDVIVRIDHTPAESFFQQQQRYIAASSAAALRHNLFLLPYLFPEHFTLTLDGDRKVTVDREKFKQPEQKTEGRWLKPGVTAYIRIPAFFHLPLEEKALDYVYQFQSAKTLIIDVRNNGGGIPPKRLIQALMGRPYHEWKQSTTLRLPLVDFDQDEEKNKNPTNLPEFLRNCKYSPDDHLCSAPLTWGGGVVEPSPNAFRGRVILLVDGGCVSACEELVEPFKDSGRGVIVGETTRKFRRTLRLRLPQRHDAGNLREAPILPRRLRIRGSRHQTGRGSPSHD